MAGSRRERELAKQKLQRQLDKQAATATKSRGRTIAVIAGVVVIALIVIGAVIAKANSGSTTASTPTPTISSAPVAYKCTPVTKLQTVAKQYPNGPENITLAQGLTLGVKLKTNCGDITIDLESQSAPENTKALIFLANTGASQVLVPGDQNSGVRQVEGYFDNTACHRLTTAGIYVLQCGDPTGTGGGGPGFKTKDENLTALGTGSSVIYPRGIVAMANAGPNTNGSQFFIVYKDSPLPPNYTVIGEVTKGLNIVESIAKDGVQGGGTDGKPKLSLILKKVDSFQTQSVNNPNIIGGKAG